MKKSTLFVIGVVMTMTATAVASNCYICGSGSSDYCKDYCKYSGSDSQENRKKCTDAGCKIGGTASCPTAVNYKVCTVGSRDTKDLPFLAQNNN